MARFVRQRAGEEFAVAWWFYYDTSDHLWACLEGHGDYNSGSAVMSDCVYDSAAEYRYDGGRARYLVRPRDPTTLDLTGGSGVSPEELAAVGAWRDFDGEDIYGDYSVALNSEGETDPEKTVITPSRAYLAGVGQSDFLGVPEYAHGDQIGTTRAISDHAGELAAQTVYTAFGERVSAYGTGNEAADRTRYGYAGSSGYEQAESQPPGTPTNWTDPMYSLGWLHVGHRYYDPSSGRFMQRDPIGIRGGLNVYAYVFHVPNTRTDPSGLESMDWSWNAFGGYIAAGTAAGAADGATGGSVVGPAGTLIGTVGGALCGACAGMSEYTGYFWYNNVGSVWSDWWFAHDLDRSTSNIKFSHDHPGIQQIDPDRLPADRDEREHPGQLKFRHDDPFPF